MVHLFGWGVQSPPLAALTLVVLQFPRFCCRPLPHIRPVKRRCPSGLQQMPHSLRPGIFHAAPSLCLYSAAPSGAFCTVFAARLTQKRRNPAGLRRRRRSACRSGRCSPVLLFCSLGGVSPYSWLTAFLLFLWKRFLVFFHAQILQCPVSCIIFRH